MFTDLKMLHFLLLSQRGQDKRFQSAKVQKAPLKRRSKGHAKLFSLCKFLATLHSKIAFPPFPPPRSSFLKLWVQL